MFEYSEIREGFKVKLFLPIKNQWQAPAELSKHEQFSLQDDTQGFFILSMLLSIFHIEKKKLIALCFEILKILRFILCRHFNFLLKWMIRIYCNGFFFVGGGGDLPVSLNVHRMVYSLLCVKYLDWPGYRAPLVVFCTHVNG